jgi:hypothetical protein
MNKFQDNYFGKGVAEIQLARFLSDPNIIDFKYAVKLARKICDYKRIVNDIYLKRVYNSEQIIEIVYKEFLFETKKYYFKYLKNKDIFSYIENVIKGYKKDLIIKISKNKLEKEKERFKNRGKFLNNDLYIEYCNKINSK